MAWQHLSDAARALLNRLPLPATPTDRTELAMARSAQARSLLPLTEEFRQSHVAIEHFRYLVRSIDDLALADELARPDRRHADRTVAEFEGIYRDYFPSSSAEIPLTDELAREAEPRVRQLVTEVENVLDAIRTWGQETGRLELAPDTIDESIRRGRGAAVGAGPTTGCGRGSTGILAPFTYHGERIGYIGSLNDGWRGPHKGMVRPNLDSFDVDMWVLHPEGVRRALRPVLRSRPELISRGKIAPDEQLTPELHDLNRRVAGALAEEFPGVDQIGGSSIMLRRDPPYGYDQVPLGQVESQPQPASVEGDNATSEADPVSKADPGAASRLASMVAPRRLGESSTRRRSSRGLVTSRPPGTASDIAAPPLRWAIDMLPRPDSDALDGMHRGELVLERLTERLRPAERPRPAEDGDGTDAGVGRLIDWLGGEFASHSVTALDALRPGAITVVQVNLPGQQPNVVFVERLADGRFALAETQAARGQRISVFDLPAPGADDVLPPTLRGPLRFVVDNGDLAMLEPVHGRPRPYRRSTPSRLTAVADSDRVPPSAPVDPNTPLDAQRLELDRLGRYARPTPLDGDSWFRSVIHAAQDHPDRTGIIGELAGMSEADLRATLGVALDDMPRAQNRVREVAEGEGYRGFRTALDTPGSHHPLFATFLEQAPGLLDIRLHVIMPDGRAIASGRDGDPELYVVRTHDHHYMPAFSRQRGDQPVHVPSRRLPTGARSGPAVPERAVDDRPRGDGWRRGEDGSYERGRPRLAALPADLRRGSASGQGNLCLVDSLVQLMQHHDTPIQMTREQLRQYLEGNLPADSGGRRDLEGRQMLDFYDPHTSPVLLELGFRLQVLEMANDGDVLPHPVVGTTGPLFHLVHRGLHFEPLYPTGEVRPSLDERVARSRGVPRSMPHGGALSLL